MSVTSGNVGDIHCCGSREVVMMKLLTLQSESGSWHYKRCSFIVKLLNIASFCLSDTHAAPLMQVTFMSMASKTHTLDSHGLSMTACAFNNQPRKTTSTKKTDSCSPVYYRLHNIFHIMKYLIEIFFSIFIIKDLIYHSVANRQCLLYLMHTKHYTKHMTDFHSLELCVCVCVVRVWTDEENDINIIHKRAVLKHIIFYICV